MPPEPAGAFAAASAAAKALSDATGRAGYDVAIVLGSGWGEATTALGPATGSCAMAGLPGFPEPTVAGHAGTVTGYEVGGRPVLVLAGRVHLYEGHSVTTVVHGVRTAIAAGCSTIVLTNAAGGLHPEWPVGEPVLLRDHLNLTGTSPLLGPAPPDGYPPRFADLSHVYSSRLRALVREAAPSIREGVYAAVVGGAYETPAEIRMLQVLGADLVGMSTALEAIAAVHLGAEVLGISLVTNLAAGLSPGPLDHGEVLRAGAASASGLGELLMRVIERL